SLRHLLTHTAGFVTDDPWGDRVLGMTPAELDALIATGKLFSRPPGLAFEYSNLGFALLGRVLTNVSGEPYQSFIRRTILNPLGMTRTTFDAPDAARGDYAWGYRLDDGKWSRERIEPDGEVGAMGGLATSVADYARYVAFLLDAWPARDDPDPGPVRRASVRELALWQSPPFPPGTIDGQPAPPSAYGYGIVHSADPRLGRCLHNRTYALMSRLTWRLAELLHAAAPRPEPAVPSAVLARAIEGVVEAYSSGRIEAARVPFAVNFLLDFPVPLRDAELAGLKQKLGEGRLEKIEPLHTLAGSFVLACERGRLKGTIVLSPDPEPGIQKLTFAVEA
ncbi:MAG: class A beta-lactamase-related serine hydrolase, partial [Alphaproteobacteria bacterium]|nr:class A beta-lactamase-related serine hydrolase [Alphaproteobacteria bacterium]